METIAHIRTGFSEKFGIPRQSGLVPAAKGRIFFEKQYRNPDAIRGIEEFSHLWLIWGFSANKKYNTKSMTVRPPRLGGNERIGVFASRSPYRPNGLGLSSVKLVDIDKGDIIVSGADLMDGTPIYDIKPYLPYVDSHPEARGGFTEQRHWKSLDVLIPEKFTGKFTERQIKELREVLALDPRPHYQDDPDRIYGMPFNGKDIHFKVEDDTLTVTGIVNL